MDDLLEDWASLGHPSEVAPEVSPPFSVGLFDQDDLVTDLRPIHLKFEPNLIEWDDTHVYRMAALQVITHFGVFHEGRLWLRKSIGSPISVADSDTVQVTGGKIKIDHTDDYGPSGVDLSA